MAAAFSQAEWLVDNAARDVGWQLVAGRVGEKAQRLNLTLDSVTGAFGSLKSSSFGAIPAIDSVVHRVLEGFVRLDLRKPSAITADLPFVRSPTPVVVAVATYIVVVWLWSSYIKWAGLKPRHDPVWLQALVVVHNCFLCCLSLYMGCGILIEARRHRWMSPHLYPKFSSSVHSNPISCIMILCSKSLLVYGFLQNPCLILLDSEYLDQGI